MRFVISAALGAAGEVRPSIAIGSELKRRGHDVCFVGNPHYAKWTAEASLSFKPVGSALDFTRLQTDASLFGPEKKSVLKILHEYYLPFVADYYAAVEEAIGTRTDAVISAEAGSVTAAEKYRVPRVKLVLSPARLASRFDPSHPERILPTWAGWFARTGRRLSVLHQLNRLRRGARWRPYRPLSLSNDNAVAALRAKVGLPSGWTPASRPDLGLCLWPEWFSAPQQDWPERTLVTGFPIDRKADGPVRRDSNPRRERPLTIAATTGSLASSQAAFFSTVVEACRQLGAAAILVTPHADHVPSHLPANIAHASYVPFEELFDRASLVIHHGGIGTTASALAAGIPQIVMPLRGEQFDIGNRAARLGVARMVSQAGTSPGELARTIRLMSGSSAVRRHCAQWQERSALDNGLARAADEIERLGARR